MAGLTCWLRFREKLQPDFKNALSLLLGVKEVTGEVSAAESQ